MIREAHFPPRYKEHPRSLLKTISEVPNLGGDEAGGSAAVWEWYGFGVESGADQRPSRCERAKKGGRHDPGSIVRRMDVQTRCNCPPNGPFMPPPMTPKIDPALHRDKKPEWIRVTLPRDPKFWSTKGLITDLKLHTVCEEAQCPNRWECWSQGSATFMIAGDRCTRACGFCAVKTAKPFALEADEPQRVAEATKRMGLNHIVITAVARDDMKDGGAEHFARTIEAVREAVPTITIEILVPDFNGKDDALEVVMKAKPHIFNHNLETVERLTPLVRSRAMYHRSLHVLKRAKAMAEELGTQCATKSGLMLGLGETETELFQAMDDLREHDVTVLTLGQYLRPSPQHLPVIEYVHPDTFENYKQIALKKGFRHVASAPLVRSSYHASDFKPELDLE